jgi:protocatechuate 3,4-dioxygenase beta subunit
VRVKIDLNRRRLIGGMAGLALTAPALASSLMRPTPRQPAGPFYPTDLLPDDDADLTFVNGKAGRAAGVITDLAGRVVDAVGYPLRGVRVEIWQCDANGRYRHPRDRGGKEPDENFQGHGHALTDPEGRYLFRTIRPVPYPGRAPHIHVAVFPDGQRPLVTQLYVSDEPRNTEDFLFNRVPAERRHLVVADFVPAAGGGEASLNARFDIVLGTDTGTPAA